MSVQVWRVEDCDGYGPVSLRHVLAYGINGPPPAIDTGDIARWWTELPASEHGAWRFGCESPEQLGRWFDDRLMGELQDEGFSVARYAVDAEAVVCGGCQVAFRAAKATRMLFTIARSET